MTTHKQRAIAKALTALIPAVPFADAEQIRRAAAAPHMKHLPPAIALWLTTIAYIRHTYTDYDCLRDEGYDKESARHFTRAAINEKLTEWNATRYLNADENEE